MGRTRSALRGATRCTRADAKKPRLALDLKQFVARAANDLLSCYAAPGAQHEPAGVAVHGIPAGPSLILQIQAAWEGNEAGGFVLCCAATSNLKLQGCRRPAGHCGTRVTSSY